VASWYEDQRRADRTLRRRVKHKRRQMSTSATHRSRLMAKRHPLQLATFCRATLQHALSIRSRTKYASPCFLTPGDHFGKGFLADQVPLHRAPGFEGERPSIASTSQPACHHARRSTSMWLLSFIPLFPNSSRFHNTLRRARRGAAYVITRYRGTNLLPSDASFAGSSGLAVRRVRSCFHTACDATDRA